MPRIEIVQFAKERKNGNMLGAAEDSCQSIILRHKLLRWQISENKCPPLKTVKALYFIAPLAMDEAYSLVSFSLMLLSTSTKGFVLNTFQQVHWFYRTKDVCIS